MNQDDTFRVLKKKPFPDVWELIRESVLSRRWVGPIGITEVEEEILRNNGWIEDDFWKELNRK